MSTSILSVLLFQPPPDFTALWCRWSCLFSFPLFAFTQSHFSLPEWLPIYCSVMPVDGWQRRTEMRERERLMDLHHYQLGFSLCGMLSLWTYIPLSLHPSLCLLSPTEPTMEELYWPRKISISLPHNTNNRSYHERTEGRAFGKALRNTSSHVQWAFEFSVPVYFVRKSISQ